VNEEDVKLCICFLIFFKIGMPPAALPATVKMLTLINGYHTTELNEKHLVQVITSFFSQT